MIDYREALERRGLEPFESGSDYLMMCCPMHDDSNPSLSVSILNGSFRCFGCEERGTFAELIAYVDDVSVDEALSEIRSEETVEDTLSLLERSLDDEEDQDICFKEKSFHNVFPCVDGTPGERYLRTRHGGKVPDWMAPPRSLTKSIVDRFDARWAPDGKYKGRVILPIRTPAGKITSYVGRTIYKGVEPKTRKSKSPGRTLFGVYELLQWTDAYEYIVLVEGEFDAMYLQQYRVPALAVMGTSPLTKYQIRILKSLQCPVILSYDGDKAGLAAMFGNGSKRIGELHVLSRILPTVALQMPEGTDPNSLTKHEVMELYGEYRVR